MAIKPTKFQHFLMRNPIMQFFTYIYLNIKILKIVRIGHDGTRNKK